MKEGKGKNGNKETGSKGIGESTRKGNAEKGPCGKKTHG